MVSGPLRHLGKLGCVRSDPYEPTSTGIPGGRYRGPPCYPCQLSSISGVSVRCYRFLGSSTSVPEALGPVVGIALASAVVGSSPYFEFANTPLEFPDVLLCHSGSMYVAGEVRFMWVVVLVGVS